MTQQSIQPSLLLAAVFAASALGAAHANAATHTPASPLRSAAGMTPTGAAIEVEAGVTGNAQRAYVDPKTHKLRAPTEEERVADSRAASFAPVPKFKIQRLANGALRAEDLSGSLIQEVQATLNPDGSVSMSDGADGAMAPTSKPAAKLEEK